jgi:hypothetical protein
MLKRDWAAYFVRRTVSLARLLQWKELTSCRTIWKHQVSPRQNWFSVIPQVGIVTQHKGAPYRHLHTITMVTGFRLYCCTLVHLLLCNLYRMLLSCPPHSSAHRARVLSVSGSKIPSPSSLRLTAVWPLHPLIPSYPVPEIISVLVLLLLHVTLTKSVRPCPDAQLVLTVCTVTLWWRPPSRHGTESLSHF